VQDRPTVFFELIERHGSQGFGKGNFKALVRGDRTGAGPGAETCDPPRPPIGLGHCGQLNYRVAMDDRELVAAIAAGDPAGIAVAYDRYAAGLYGYCHWMLNQAGDPGEAVQETFVVAATLGDLPEAPKLRPWLYAVARNECLRRRGTPPADPVEQANAPDHAAHPAGQPADQADQPAEVSDPEQAELQKLIQAVLAELGPDEREVIELSLRHDLYDSDLATVLGVSWGEAYTLTSRARSQLEKNLGALLVARNKREDCPALGTLLADWDGELTEQTRDLVGEHIEHCGICAGYRRAALRPAALSGLQPLAVPPAGLRDEVMKLCSPTTPETPMYRRSAERVHPASFPEAIRAMSWEGIRSNPGAAIAAGAVLLWIVAAVIVTLLTLAGSHPAQALAAGPTVSASLTSPAPVTTPGTTPAATRTSAAARPSPNGSSSSAASVPVVGQSGSPGGNAGLTSAPPSRSPSPNPSKSASPKPSKSSSPSPSSSPSSSSSSSPSPSKSS
jgi:RNA polymerase sigma factor (sigma-70 family)